MVGCFIIVCPNFTFGANFNGGNLSFSGFQRNFRSPMQQIYIEFRHDICINQSSVSGITQNIFFIFFKTK